MLTLITGGAGAGKTALCMDEIKRAVQARKGGRLMIVPEQYSHEAERELARTAGPALPLYAEVMSFTALARRVEEEVGTRGRKPLDKGGRLLCMALCLNTVGARLRVYGSACRKADAQLALLGAIDELKAARITPEILLTAAGEGGALGRKLEDIALILGAYDAVVGAGRADPADRLTRLAEALPESSLGREGHIYIDGFTDFTAQEFEIIRLLMKKGADMTVCLTCDSLSDGSEVFELSRRTGRALIHAARELGIEYKVRAVAEADQSAAPDYLAARLFSYSGARYPGDAAMVTLLSAETVNAECEAAAAKCLELCRDFNYRWRDIAVAVRGFEDYRPALEAAFRYYGVPLFAARKSEIMQKPLPALIASAYEILEGGWEADDVFAYLRTGLAGLEAAEIDILENYCLMWSCRAAAWLSDKDWRMHPEGYGGRYDEKCAASLAEINALRRRVAEPLLKFKDRCGGAHTASAQAEALAALFDDLSLPERLSERADALEAQGLPAAAAEYQRLWDVCVGALEQTALILGDSAMETEEFSRLFSLTLSRYDVGIIPVSPDMVTAGDFDRMRRRNIRHLIVLGASDERLPGGAGAGGVFTPDERRTLLERGVDLGGGEDAELWREFSLIYNCLSLPSDGLTLIMPAYGADGGPARPSFVMNRASALFDKPIVPADARALKSNAPGPALELAAASLRIPGDTLARGAAEFFNRTQPGRLSELAKAAELSRGALSPDAARALYGDKLWLSASRIDKFASCRFAYFMRYGLLAKPRQAAEFSPPEYGTLMHYILQNTAMEAKAAGGFSKLSPEALDALTDKYLEAYIKEELPDFSERGARFQYLFRRLADGAKRIVADMADELKNSDFRPLDFELDFSRLSGAVKRTEDGGTLRLAGVADRVDGWVRGDKLYLRVVDYKTGRKSFSLSDLYYGKDLQMLLYLFTLSESGAELYGKSVESAGVLYVPARDEIVKADADMSDEEIAKKRLAGLRRSGLVLDDPEVLRAMENSDSPRRLPVKWKAGVPTGESLASAERLGKLKKFIDDALAAMAQELKRGSISADPYYKGAQDNACLYCEYLDPCRFSDGEGGDRRRYLEKLSADKFWYMLESNIPEGGGVSG